jgi:hypothetical protein
MFAQKTRIYVLALQGPQFGPPRRAGFHPKTSKSRKAGKPFNKLRGLSEVEARVFRYPPSSSGTPIFERR